MDEALQGIETQESNRAQKPARQKPAERKPTEQEPSLKKGPALVYVGPNLGAPLYLKRYQAFVNGVLPPHVQQACDEDKNLAALFVSAHGLATAQQELLRRESRIAKAFATVDLARMKKEA